MKLWEYVGKRIRIQFSDGDVLSGNVSLYISALDNEPDGACIYIGDTEILESEIANIEVISE